MTGGDNYSNATASEYDGGESNCDEESYEYSSSDSSSNVTRHCKTSSSCRRVDEVITKLEDSSSSSVCVSDDGTVSSSSSYENDEDVKSTSRDTKSTDSSSTATQSIEPQDLHYYVVFECKPPSSRMEKSSDLESTTSSLTVSSCSLSEDASNDDDECKCDYSATCSERNHNKDQGIDCGQNSTCGDNDFEFLLDNTTDLDILDTFTMMDLSSSGSKRTRDSLNEKVFLDSTSRTSGTFKRSVDQCCIAENQIECRELEDESPSEKINHPVRPQKLRRLYSMTSTVGSSCRDFLRLLQDSNCDGTKRKMEDKCLSQNSTTSLSSFSSREDNNCYDEQTFRVSF